MLDDLITVVVVSYNLEAVEQIVKSVVDTASVVEIIAVVEAAFWYAFYINVLNFDWFERLVSSIFFHVLKDLLYKFVIFVKLNIP